MNIKLLCLFLTLIFVEVKGQDTIFLAKHIFTSPVRNVFRTDKDLFVKTGEGLLKRTADGWEDQNMIFKKPYVFYDNGFFEADFIVNKAIFDARSMAHLIPQRSLSSATLAESGDHFFVAVAGSLFEYAVTKLYRRTYTGLSIRDIYFEPGLKVISTYSGIFVNDSIKAAQPGHSNGPFCNILGQHYLCSDQLYRYDPDSGFQVVPTGDNVFAGYVRKLVEFRGRMYSLNTKSVNIVDSGHQLRPIQQGLEYYDMEVVGDRLLFSAKSGEVFQFDGKDVSLLCKLSSRVRDIYADRSLVYLSSDEGVFTLRDLKSETLSPLTNTPFAVMTLVDPQKNTWISTENGLFLLPDKSKDPIPFIPNVEFNRGALFYFADSIYAGSVEGVFVIDTYNVIKNFLPQHEIRVRKLEKEQRITWGFWFAGIVSLILLAALGVRSYRKRRPPVILPQKEVSPVLTLKDIGEVIRSQGIMTVEGLAEYYHTNTVQLNRIFKNFDTTPGKFMKKVKLDLASELLKKKIPIDEVAIRVGYSAAFLKKEIPT